MLPPLIICDQWLQTRTFLQTAYRHVFTNLSLVSYPTVCSYQSLKEYCVNATELPFIALWNFVCCLELYRLCSQFFFNWRKRRRKIALCSSELSLDTPWNFMRTFQRTFFEKSLEDKNEICAFRFHYFCTILHLGLKLKNTSKDLESFVWSTASFRICS